MAATKSSPIDVVTEMDIASEKLITGFLRERRPDDGFLGEEGASIDGSSGVRWVIDPVDGTVNYLYGLPSWSVSIAAEKDGEVVVGVVAAPMRGETYQAVLGRGAFNNGRLHPPPARAAAVPGAARHRFLLPRRAPGRPGRGAAHAGAAGP